MAEVWPFGIKQSGMSIERFCEFVAGQWRLYWVWRKSGRFVEYPTSELAKFCEELGEEGEFDDVILTNA